MEWDGIGGGGYPVLVLAGYWEWEVLCPGPSQRLGYPVLVLARG